MTCLCAKKITSGSKFPNVSRINSVGVFSKEKHSLYLPLKKDAFIEKEVFKG